MWDEERQLDVDEKPLAVQLNWTADERDGRFVLKTDKDRLEVKKPPVTTSQRSSNLGIYGAFVSVLETRQAKDKGGVIQSFKRTLWRKEEKIKHGGSQKDSGDEAG